MSEIKAEMKNGERKKGGKWNIVICLLVAVVVLLCLVTFLLLKDNKTSENLTSSGGEAGRGVVVAESNVDQVLDQMKEEAANPVLPGNYEVTQSFTWNFEDGESVSTDAFVRNSNSNTNDVFFDVLVNDTEEIIYKSPIIPLGSELEGIKLDKDLDAGTYECVMVYHLIDNIEDRNTISTLRIQMTIVVAH